MQGQKDPHSRTPSYFKLVTQTPATTRVETTAHPQVGVSTFHMILRHIIRAPNNPKRELKIFPF